MSSEIWVRQTNCIEFKPCAAGKEKGSWTENKNAVISP